MHNKQCNAIFLCIYVHVLWVSAQFGIEKHRVGFLESPSTADYRFKASKRDEYADYTSIGIAGKEGKLSLVLYLYAWGEEENM